MSDFSRPSRISQDSVCGGDCNFELQDRRASRYAHDGEAELRSARSACSCTVAQLSNATRESDILFASTHGILNVLIMVFSPI